MTDFPHTIKMTAIDEFTSGLITEERCLGQLRWVKSPSQDTPLGGKTMTTSKLQQLWEVRKYNGSKPVSAIREWRDVPTITQEESDATRRSES